MSYLFRQLAIGIVFFSVSFAQTITGTLQDALKQPVSGLVVTATHAESGSKVDVVTDDAGNYRFGGLRIGSYTITADLDGSKIEVRARITSANEAVNTGTQTFQPPEVREAVTVTARRVEEEAQDVPIPVSVINGRTIDRAGAFNVNRLKELVPTVQFYSSNPRNSAINIRGLGSPFGLTNDGIEPGVGFYVDGVFFARPAAATLDFIDLERVEVLRGPQGTLFGKNTTAGALNITTRRPSFTPESNVELNFGNLGFIQAKASISGPIGKKLAARLSFSGTQRDGMLYNVRAQQDVNDLNNLGFRAQVLYNPKENVTVLFSADVSRQRPRGYAQVVVGVAPTLRAANRQYNQIAADLNYRPPSWNPFDRLIDTDTSWRSNQDMGGGSVTVDWDRGKGVLTSITAYRFWDWNPSNDRDFIGLPVTTASAAPSYQTQFTQEVRYAAKVNDRLNYLVGVFVFSQGLKPSPFHKQEQGSAAARFLLAPTAAALTPGLLDGYGQNINFDFRNTSSAGFGQIEYALTRNLKIIPGLRLNYDQKTLDYNQVVYGGLQTSDPALIALQRSILAPLQYKADVGDGNVSGQLTLSYKLGERANAYATYSTGFKSIGLNLGGVPTDAAGNPVVSAATVRPERVGHWELGVKSTPFANTTVNVAAFHTNIHDFQTQVVNAQVGVLRGYLANAERVRVRGVELDVNTKLNPELTVFAALAFTDGRYLRFPDAPPPLEETGGPAVKDVSGTVLPGISKWAYSTGAEYARRKTVWNLNGEWFARVDASYRSPFSSNPSASRYLIAGSYGLVNPRVGFRSVDGWSVSVWGRNLLNENYFEFLSAAPGNSGLIVGLPGDRRTFGLTLARTFR
ncbi:TonB-dependent receptor [Bryobacterales bacterium F-183]|nr:TonB-dependent receptor [Bryobacterales bacterium F-183]